MEIHVTVEELRPLVRQVVREIDAERDARAELPVDDHPCEDRLLLDEREAARRLGVSERTMFNLRQSGEIVHVPMGRRVFYHVPDLEDFIEQRKVRPRQPAPSMN